VVGALGEEARRQPGVVVVLGEQLLEGDLAAQLGIEGGVDLAHAALAEELEQLVLRRGALRRRARRRLGHVGCRPPVLRAGGQREGLGRVGRDRLTVLVDGQGAARTAGLGFPPFGIHRAMRHRGARAHSTRGV
jgi:hypothetical protein